MPSASLLSSFVLLVVALAAAPRAPHAAREGDGGAPTRAQEVPQDAARVQRPVVEGSLFTSRLFLDEQPPELRSLRHVQIMHTEALGAARTVRRTRAEALEMAANLRRALLEGADFDALARVHSAASNAAIGSVMGTFPPGVLYADFDRFLFAAEIGEFSEPIDAPTGVHVLQRVERQAGCRELRIADTGPEGEKRIRELLALLREGADFAALATEFSQEPVSAACGGALAVFERGPADRLLKGEVFRLRVGEVSEPIASPLGWHLVKRVPIDELPPELVEFEWMRFRGLALLHDENPLGLASPPRSSAETSELAREIERRLAAGEDFVELVKLFDDDFADGRAREGLIGWVHRRQPGVPAFMAEAFTLEVGAWLGPTATNVGWVFVRREA
jgi:parvulin-like peptidyl-prolyl isomerase